jgi:flagellar biosynthesis protein FlhG
MSHPVRVIAVTSGKGGVGKTSVTINLALALAGNHKQVMLLDADLGLANIDVLLGLHPTYNLTHVLNGERSLEEIIVQGPMGIRIIPAASGINRMTQLTGSEHAGLIQAFSELSSDMDVLLIDTAAGISDSVITFSRAAQEVIVVLCDEPASITDACALIKVLSRDHGVARFHILANMVASVVQGQELYQKFSRVVSRFLDVTLQFMGAVPFDEQFRKAIQKQRALVEMFPTSRGALAFKRLAAKTEDWPLPQSASGYLEFFVERLVRFGSGT